MLRLFCFALLCFALLCFVFRRYAFVEAAALRSIVLRYAGAPIATRVSFFFEISLFPEYCLYHCRFLFVWRVRRTFFPSRMVFFYLVTTGWILDISLCENSFIHHSFIIHSFTWHFENLPKSLLKKNFVFSFKSTRVVFLRVFHTFF